MSSARGGQSIAQLPALAALAREQDAQQSREPRQRQRKKPGHGFARLRRHGAGATSL